MKPLPAWARNAILAVLVVGAYANAAHAPFVFDDVPGLVNNPSIRSLSPQVLVPAPGTTLSARPFANLTFALNHAVSGLRLAPLHWTNLALHLATAFLLMALLLRTLQLPRCRGWAAESASGIALVAALVWALHPVQTESVTYLVQRVEVLAALFLLFTLYAALRAHQAERPFAWSALAVLACGLGMGSKETMAVAPVLVVLYDWTFLFDSLAEAFRKRARLYGGLAATWVVLVLQLATSFRHGSLDRSGAFQPLEYLAMQPGAMMHYLRILLVPAGLTFDFGEAGCTVPLAHAADWAAPAALVLALLAASLWVLRRRKAAGFLGTAFFILLAPSSSVVPIVTEVISEHRLYLPSAAVAILGVLAAARLLGRRPALAAGFAAFAVLGLAALTVRRNQDYRSNVALWQDTVGKRPQNSRAWMTLAAAYATAGDRARADQAYREGLRVTWDTCRAALKRDPSSRLLLRQAAVFEELNYGLTGDPAALDRAIDDYRRYLALTKDDGSMQLSLAHALEKRGRMDEALVQYSIAAALLPRDFGVANDAANCLARAGRSDEAAAMYGKALSLEPGSPIGHYNYAGFLARTGRYSEALDEFDQALALDGGMAAAWHRRGLVAAWAGRPAEAVKDLETAVRIEPGREQALEDLAWLLATHPDAHVRNGARSLELAQKAPGDGVHGLEVLAAAQAETGRFQEAQQTIARAAALLPARPNPRSESLRAYAAAYRAGQAWREVPGPKH